MNEAPILREPDLQSPPAAAAAAPEIELRQVLIAYKQMLVALFVTTLVVIAALILLLLPYSFVANPTGAKQPAPIIFVVILAGCLGAFCSALTRLYNFEELPKALIVRELQGLPKTHLVIYSVVPAVIGAIAATVLYLVFAGGLLQGDFFPKFRCDIGDDKCDQFTTLLDNWHPAFAPDYAKMMVWAFAAGFVERLVPNTMHSLARAAGQTFGNK